MKTISVDELKKKLETGYVVLIDVREPVEHKNEKIEGAHLVPLSEISIDKLPSLDHPIIVHCKSGRRSLEACQKLISENSNLEVYSLEGGIEEWKKAGFEIKKSDTNILSLERQTSIFIGFFIFLGIILGAYVNPFFCGVSAVMSLGLMISGLTGNCALTRVLSKMPWNQY